MTGTATADFAQTIAAAEAGVMPNPVPLVPGQQTEIETFAHRHGLHTSFVHLVKALSMYDLAYWRRVADVLRPSIDTRAVVREWMAWVWNAPETGLRDGVRAAELRECCDRVMDLHLQALRGAAPTRADWRQARSALSAAQGDDPVANAMSDVAAAAAWDIDVATGAPTDVIQAWIAARFAEIDHQIEWTDEKSDTADARLDAIMSAGQAAVEALEAQSRDPKDPETQRLKADAFERGARIYAAANPSDLDRREELRNEAMDRVYESGRAGLLRAISAAPATPDA
ncbi:hypothetical protein [Sphingomonas carotinifaciens]|uniref:Uncharacterized protein n=1 Tax=Sphingomonas carotinifaciens TaxID=1166323 RepID=A0A1G7M4A0_9SPHN|nr:hypothetical protein [Sphingomonas carotinifaciens]MBB4086942.1 hypothetical protein [Sphingomonas carotinifaciens]MWC42136.1 hypothetical protein [Sphingomonas carotinifaciens]SDF55989.1 hypothetical protein SAMN05216557_10453 [Sphingomonas carotinifaciens]